MEFSMKARFTGLIFTCVDRLDGLVAGGAPEFRFKHSLGDLESLPTTSKADLRASATGPGSTLELDAAANAFRVVAPERQQERLCLEIEARADAAYDLGQQVCRTVESVLGVRVLDPGTLPRNLGKCAWLADRPWQ